MAKVTDFWRDRRVLVTGCTGLVGAWTVRALVARQAHVVGLIRDDVWGSELLTSGLANRIDCVHGAVEDLALLERTLAEYEIQTAIHLAAQTIVDIARRSPLSTFETNIKGTWCLLEASRRCGFSPDVIVASSDKAYGEQIDLPYTEDSPLLGRYPYDASKACADILALTYHRTYGTSVCVTRCANFFGPGDLNWNRLVPGTIRSVLRGERPQIRSDGKSIRDYLYVKDGAAAYLHVAQCLAERPELAGEAFNFSTESKTTTLAMVKRILSLMKSPLRPDVQNRASGEIHDQCLCAAKARRLLAWRPRYSLDEALKETIDWYGNYLAAGRSGQKSYPRPRRAA
jgi:CDP-glucose 4,6-dehydratase